MNTPIAIVGLGCRFAGAPDALAYWDMTREGRDGFGPVPPDRWSHDQFFDANPRATDKSYAPNGGFIEDIRSFPALHFGIPPRRVEVMDPQQRFSIEVALQAIQDAGYQPSEMARRTGVYLGITASEWRLLLQSRATAALMASGAFGEAPGDLDQLAAAVANVVPSRPFTAAGALANMNAAAVAQELDLHGPAYTVDAACASGLIAVANAVADLRNGTVDAALAGGAYLCITPVNHVSFSRIGAISKSGVCRPFDARADGFVQGDGVGYLVLKRLDDAKRDGDRVYALLSGVASNNDGRGDGPMAPLLSGQINVIQDAWKDAGTPIEQLGYVETHGTGTLVGDATEFEGLTKALGSKVRHAALGSSKGNVGHTMSAAGIAGVIRAAQAIHYGTIPPMAGFGGAKDELGLDASPFHVPTSAEPWTGKRVAAVSSFGFGGTNAHLVLESLDDSISAPVAQAELLLLAAPSLDELRRQAAALAVSARKQGATLAGIARALAARTPQPHRLALVADDLEQAIEQLELFATNGKHDARIGHADEPARVGFLFPGQGAQRTGMLAEARTRFPIIEQTLAEVEAAVQGVLPLPLTHYLYPELRSVPVDEAQASLEITDTAICQPVMFACSLALGRLLESVGVKPVVATGHSLGEFNAAVTGHVIDAQAAARFVTARGQAMAGVKGDPGTMAAVNADRDTTQALLVEGAVIANVNHPRQSVVSGTTAAVAAVVERAQAAQVGAKQLEVSHAFHSHVFDGLDAEPWLNGTQLHDPILPVASGIATRPYADAADARGVFLRHTRSPVDFVGALQQCLDVGANVLLQVGAGGPLASFARGSVGKSVRGIQSLGNRRDDDGGRSLLEGLGWLWCMGANVDVRPITAAAPVSEIPPEVLPREIYWPIKESAQIASKFRAVAGADAAPVAAERPVAAQSLPPVLDDTVDADSQKVMAVVAKVSAYPLDALKPTMRLIDDLGFDSLMVGDLATALADAFPGLGGIPQELLINGPTVQDLIDYVAAGPENATIDDEAPLTAYAPVWQPAARLGANERDLRGATFWSNDPALTALDGLQRVSDASDPVDLLVWFADGDQTDALTATLVAQLDRGAAPDLLVVAHPEDVAAECLAGVARAYAVERDVVAKCLRTTDRTVLRAEWLDADRTSDVRIVDGVRSIRGFQAAPTAPAFTLKPGDTVLISGGTSGIGRTLAEHFQAQDLQVIVVGRSAKAPEGTRFVQADVTDAESLSHALAGIHADVVIHCAGILADGPLETVAAESGRRARSVKTDGWNNLVRCLPKAKVVLGIGSWAGRFGNRHQVHYAAGNAGMAALAEAGLSGGGRAVVVEFGPWTSSDMVRSIPAPIQSAMRAEGVDFVGDDAGMQAILGALASGVGVQTLGRNLPSTTRTVRRREVLDVSTHPFLADHAIEGTPVLPLASAADLLVSGSGLSAPFELDDLRLYQGVPVTGPTVIETRIRGDRAELRVGDRLALAYRARVRPFTGDVVDPGRTSGGEAPKLSLAEFYGGITFHGPLLQGITAIEAVGADFVRGRVRPGTPRAWIPGTTRSRFAVDPLALDSAMQLSGYVAWVRYQRAGTPVGIGRLVQLRPLPEGELIAEVRFGDREENRFSGTVTLRDLDGNLLLIAEDTVAELRRLESADAEPFEVKRQWVDFSTWPALKDLDIRLEMAQATGIRNPYFSVHEGTARNTTVVAGRTLTNFSSYNYLGLSGDPRVVQATQDAVARYGTSVSASRVASGERPFHGQLERILADCQGAEDALVFTAGHATNVTTIGHLMGPKDLVMHDEFIHDSALQGIRLAGCARRGFKHDDPKDLENQLKDLRRHYEKVLIVVEGVYSMDGDICDLPAYIALKKKYGCLLMCDEAHSFGVVGKTGKGVGEHFGIDGSEIDIWMGTLSKSVASCGGWICGSAPMIRYLRYTAPGFVYSAGITAANGVAALTSLELMLEEPWRVEKLQANCQLFHDELVARGIDTGPALGGSAVIPAITGNSLHALLLSQRLGDEGVNVQPIVYPAVADNAARLRFFLSSTHTDAELVETAEKVARLLAKVREEYPVL